MRHRSRDKGSVHVLEAIIVTSIMLSAVAFVVTYDQPASTAANAREGLTRIADDALAILHETPVESKFGDTALSAYIAECLNGMCDNLVAKLDALVPAGGAYALYVSNGYDTYPVYVVDEPTGEAVAAAQAFEPQWSSTFVSTATDLVGVGDALLTYALPVFNSNVVTPGGSHLVMKMEGSRRDGSDYVMIASYSTVARPDSDPASTAASLYFVDADGQPMAVHNLTDAQGNEREVILRLEETNGGAIPAGVQVDVELPRGWIGRAEAPENDGWDILANATDKNGAATGSRIQATLNQTLSEGHIDLHLTFTYQGDVLDYYPVHARLSRGALATASLLLRGEERDGAPVLATPAMGMSVPGPMGNALADPTTWTMYAYVPVEKSGFGEGDDMSAEVQVRRIEVRELEGNAIFGDVTGLRSMGGEWESTGASIVWHGDFNLSHDNVLNLTFQVEASGVAGPSEARAAFVPPIRFDQFTGRIVERSGWGFHRQPFLPATSEYGGFNPDATGGPESWKAPHPVSTDAIYRSTPLPGRATYNATVLGSVEDALYGAYVAAQERSVPVGGEVVVDANVQSLIFQLAEAGQKAGVTLRFYPPWAADARQAIFEQSNLDQGLLSSEVTKIVMVDLNDDGYPDPVVGTSNGRVIAYSGLTGQRIQGNSFTAPVTAAAKKASTLPRVTDLALATFEGKPYIVVGTDRNSDGLFVLNKSLELAWYWKFTGADVLALDASTSFDGDAEPEIAVARSVDSGASTNTLSYVFRANPRTQAQIETGTAVLLEPIPAKKEVIEDRDAFAYSLGKPAMIRATPRAGPYGETAGLLVPLQTTADAGLVINENELPPSHAREAPSTPRAGVLALNDEGVATSTLFGAPAGVIRTHDRGGDEVDDIVMGGTSGYVVMANGSVLTQPLYSYLLAPTPSIIDADTLSSDESYILTEAGAVIMTDDGWITNWGPDTSAHGARAIAANRHNSFWVVGAANGLWKSEPSVDPPLPSRAHMPPAQELVPVLLPKVNGDVTYLSTKIHDFNDVWFREDEGWIVGSHCSVDPTCPELPIVLHTTDGGETWSALGEEDFSDVFEGPLTRVEFMADGTGWILGERGTLLRKLPGEEVWTKLLVDFQGTTYDLLDIDCRPNALDHCFVVGEAGALFGTKEGWEEPPASPMSLFFNLTGQEGLPEDKTLYSVGFQNSERVYIGSENRIFARFDDADWTTLPMNYVQNDARVINALGDGSGYIYGGSAANGRIWLLHDFHTQSQAQTIDLAGAHDVPPGAVITAVSLEETDVSLGGQKVAINAATNGENWHHLGVLQIETDDPTADARQAFPISTTFAPASSGDELRFNITMNTSGDKTIVSPHVRLLKFRVDYTLAGTPDSTTVALDFDDDAWMDEAKTTADWNLTAQVLRQRIVAEYWTRNVNGQVLDILGGYDPVNGDGVEDFWVGTGDVLAENSPDHAIYAPDITTVIEPDYRVHLLNGFNGDPHVVSERLEGEVRALRAAEKDGSLESLFALTWDGNDAFLYTLNPWTLQELRPPVRLEDEMPVALEIGALESGRAAAYVGTQRPPDNIEALGHLWAFDTLTQKPVWRAIPDDLGKYQVRADVPPGWLFGPYVIEVEVEWQEATSGGGGLPSEVLRSARFYDHFMVTPPDVLSPPTPVYTARLLVWMRDWG